MRHRARPGAKPTDIDVTGKTATWSSSAAECDTAERVFGSSSIHIAGSPGYVSFADAEDWAMGTGEATWEFWGKMDGPNSSGDVRISLCQANVSMGFSSVLLAVTTSNNAWGQTSDGSTTRAGGGDSIASGWHHVALVRIGANLYLYTDGVRKVIATNLNGVTLMNSTGNMVVGANIASSNQRQWKGWLDQIRITKGVARYTTPTFNVPTGPFPSSPVVRPPGDPYWSNVVLLLDASNYADGTTPSTLDVTGKTPTWTDNAQIKTTQYKFGSSSMYFDGTLDRVSFADSDDWAMGLNDFTVEAWIRMDSSVSDQVFFCGQSNLYNGFYPFSMGVSSGRSLFPRISNGSSAYGVAGGAAMAKEVWHHVALVRAGGYLYGYTNGVRSIAASGISSVDVLNSVGRLAIGAYSDFDAVDFKWKGYLDQVRITKGVARYTTATINVPTEPFPHGPPAEQGDPHWFNVGFLLHFDGPNASTTITDSGPRSRTFTRSGSGGTAEISTSQSVFGGSSWRHASSTRYVSTPADATYITASGSTPWTLEFRARFDNFSAARVLFDNNDSSSNTTGWSPFIGADGKMWLWSGPQAISYGGHGSAMSTGTWYALAITWDGTTLRFFRDGVLQGTNTGFTNVWGNSVFLWNSTYLNQGCTGYFDEVRYTKGIARYTANYTIASEQFPHGPPIAPSEDPYWNNVVLLVDASDYAYASTPDTLDITGKHPIWREAARIDTGQHKFGSSSIYLRGGSTADRVVFDDSPDWAMGTGDATWECWMRPENDDDNGVLLSQAMAFSGFYSVQFYRAKPSTRIQAWVSDGSTSYGSLGTVDTVKDSWHHIALVRSGANLYSYVNGTLIHHSASLSGVALMNSPGKMCIGSYADDGNTNSNFAGWIDQVRITKGVARYTGATISIPTAPFPHGQPNTPSGDPYWPYVSLLIDGTQGTAADIGPLGLTVSTHGSPVISGGGGTGWLYLENGDAFEVTEADAGAAPFAFGTGDFTIEVDSYRTTAGVEVGLIDTRRPAAGSPKYANHYISNTNKLSVYNSSSVIGNTGTSLAVNTWNRIVFTRVSGTLVAYLNGVRIWSTAYSGSYASNSPCVIGNNFSYSATAPHRLRNIRITKGVSRYGNNDTITQDVAPFPRV